MTAREIIDAYALRWTIEPMFCSLKHGIGVKETWQRLSQPDPQLCDSPDSRRAVICS